MATNPKQLDAAPPPDPFLADGAEVRLSDVPLHQVVELVRIDLPSEQIEPLLERGVLPGCHLCPVRRSPFGDPVVDVEGSLLALRREVACRMCVRVSEP